METAFLVVKTVAVIVAVVALIVWIVIEHRRKHPKMCDSCDQLYMSQRHSCSAKVLYKCYEQGHFYRKNAPTYCKDYRQREEND